MQNHIRSQTSGGDIDLVDIWLKVLRYRIAFAGAVLCVIFAGGLIHAVAPSQYEYKLVMEIGGVWTGVGIEGATADHFEHLESPEVVKIKIEEIYLDSIAAQIDYENAGAIAESVAVDVPGTGIVELTTTQSLKNAEMVNALLDSVADRVLESHNTLFKARVDTLREMTVNELEELGHQIDLLQASRNEIVRNGSVESKGISLLMMDSNIQRLVAERSHLKRQLEVGLMLNTRATHVIAGPSHDPRPAGAKLMVKMAISALLGVIAGFVVVAVLTLNESAKRRLSE